MPRSSIPLLLAAALLAAGCDDDAAPLPAEGDTVRFLRVVDYAVDCFETDAPENRVFRSQAEWNSFFSGHVICYDDIDVVTPPPKFDFDRYALLMVLHEGNCTYSGCAESYPLITGMRIEQLILNVYQRAVTPTELGGCLGCVQPRDLVLVDAAVADAYPIAFQPR